MFRLTLLAGPAAEARPGGGYLTFLADEPEALVIEHIGHVMDEYLYAIRAL